MAERAGLVHPYQPTSITRGKPAGRHQNISGRAKRPFYGFGPHFDGHQTTRAAKDASGFLSPAR